MKESHFNSVGGFRQLHDVGMSNNSKKVQFYANDQQRPIGVKTAELTHDPSPLRQCRQDGGVTVFKLL